MLEQIQEKLSCTFLFGAHPFFHSVPPPLTRPFGTFIMLRNYLALRLLLPTAATSLLLTLAGSLGAQTIPGPEITAPLPPPEPEHANLLQNPSFERFATSGAPDAWSRLYGGAAGSERSTTRARAGKNSLKLTDNSNTTAVGVHSDPIPVTEGATYLVEGSTFREQATASPSVYVRFYDANMLQIGNLSSTASGDVNTWHDFSAEFRAPIGARYARLLCYSHQVSVGTIYFDALSFRHSDNLVNNPNMSQDLIGAHPTGWERLNCLSQQGMVAAAPDAPSNKVMMVVDNSTTADAGFYTSVAVTPNQTYTLEADVYWDTGAAPSLQLRYYDKAGNELGGEAIAATQKGTWQRRSVSARAPAGAATARLIPYIDTASTGLAYFDNFSLLPVSETRYVAPQARGTGDGSSPQNAALFNNAAFWTATNNRLIHTSIKVVFLEGRYVINANEDRLYMVSIGSQNHLLTLEGERPFGSVFTRTAAATTDLINMVSTRYSKNIVFRNLHWEDDSPSGSVRTGYSLALQYQSSNIIVEGCSFVGLWRNYYGAFGAHHAGTNNITVRRNEFVGGGSGTHFHMIYNSYQPSNLTTINNYFQDAAGAYVRHRAGASNVVVKNNRFVSTARTYNQRFLEQAVFNDVNPGDEILGPDLLYEDNIFDYKVSASPNVAISFHTSGYDPTVNGVTWIYSLNTAQRNTLLNGTTAAKRTLVLNHFGMDFEKTHIIRHNTFTGSHTYKIRLETKSNYGSPNRGGNGDYNISVLVDN